MLLLDIKKGKAESGKRRLSAGAYQNMKWLQSPTEVAMMGQK